MMHNNELPKGQEEPSKSAESSTAPVKRIKKSASAFRTISEVADELDVQQHVLRFWETKFSQVKPLKRGGGRRYYRPEDVDVLKKIHHLLYTEGYTIKGVQKLLRGQGKQQIVQSEIGAPANQSDKVEEPKPEVIASNNAEGAGLSGRQKAILQAMLGDLKELRNMIAEDDE